MIKITQMLAPVIPSGARSGRKLAGFIGVTIHNTGNAGKGANAEAHGHLMQGGGKTKQVSWHYAVDERQAVQSIPESEVAWHAADGTGPGNTKTIAIEICMNCDGDLRKATDNGAELAADILKRHGVVKAAGHLYQHHDWSGKNCPQMIRDGKPYCWETFCSKVQEILDGEGEEEMTEAEIRTIVQEEIRKALTGADTIPADWVQKTGELEQAKADGFTDGTRPGGYTQRQESAAMLERLKKQILDQIGAK